GACGTRLLDSREPPFLLEDDPRGRFPGGELERKRPNPKRHSAFVFLGYSVQSHGRDVAPGAVVLRPLPKLGDQPIIHGACTRRPSRLGGGWLRVWAAPLAGHTPPAARSGPPRAKRTSMELASRIGLLLQERRNAEERRVGKECRRAWE